MHTEMGIQLSTGELQHDQPFSLESLSSMLLMLCEPPPLRRRHIANWQKQIFKQLPSPRIIPLLSSGDVTDELSEETLTMALKAVGLESIKRKSR
jgi:hypothetical protein